MSTFAPCCRIPGEKGKDMTSSGVKLDRETSDGVAADLDPSAGESTIPTTDDSDGAADGEAHGSPQKASSPRRVSINLRSLLVSMLVAVLCVAIGILTWLYIGSRNELDAQARRANGDHRAERTASEYAVSAAAVDYRNLAKWRENLVKGTTPELRDKLEKAATSMEQILSPLQWDSTASALASKVRSEANGVYTVDTFVSVLTKSMQAPEGLQSTATYRVTIDSHNNWLITDVGGIDTAVGKR